MGDTDDLDNFFATFGNTPDVATGIDREAVDAIAAQSERILAAVQPFASLSGDFQKLNAERLCVCIKQHHGQVHEFAIMTPEQFHQWLLHQNELVDLQQTISECTSSNAKLFLEGKAKFQHTTLEHFEEWERNLRLADGDRNFSASLQRAICDAIATGNTSLAQGYHCTIAGNERFANMQCAEDPKRVAHVYTLQYPNRDIVGQTLHQARQLLDYEQVKALGAQDFHEMHQHTLSMLHAHLLKGETGMVLLGGRHFNSQEPEYELRRYVEYDQSVLRETFENHMHQYADTRNTRFMILEPNHYRLPR